MQFRFINIPATFQKRINSVLGEYLDKFIITYLNNIIIYFNSKEEHFQYIKQVLQRLADKKMLVAIKKYEFHMIKTEFCRFIIKLRKLSIDPKKIKVIVNWQELSNITELKSFLGFYNYYQRFIAIQLKNIKLFTKLTKKNKLWKQQKEQQTLFKELKELFTVELILKIYTPSLLIVVKTDASDFALSIYLV